MQVNQPSLSRRATTAPPHHLTWCIIAILACCHSLGQEGSLLLVPVHWSCMTSFTGVLFWGKKILPLTLAPLLRGYTNGMLVSSVCVLSDSSRGLKPPLPRCSVFKPLIDSEQWGRDQRHSFLNARLCSLLAPHTLLIIQEHFQQECRDELAQHCESLE